MTIVTPAYNQAQYLRETVDSVLAQTYPAIEYIVINDGSTDETAEILATLPARVVTLSQANAGQARTLNRGWDMAKGEYLAYLSSDDILYPDAVAELVAALRMRAETVCVFPDCDLIDTKSRIIKRNVCKPFDLTEVIIRQELYIGPGALFRRSGYEKVGGWRADFRLAPDREFWIRLSSVGQIDFLPRTLAGYRMQPQSICYTETSEDVIGREYLSLLDEYFAHPAQLPAGVVGRKAEAEARIKLMQARNSLRAGRFRRGRQFYAEACAIHSPLGAFAIKVSLLRNIVSKPIRMALDRLRTWLDAPGNRTRLPAVPDAEQRNSRRSIEQPRGSRRNGGVWDASPPAG